MPKLTEDIIKKYSKEEWTEQSCKADFTKHYKFDNGLELKALSVCCGEPCDIDTLYAYEDQIYIETEEELQDLLSKTLDEIEETIDFY